jgi:MFS transporter, DHA1 family, multidrug resistance protein
MMIMGLTPLVAPALGGMLLQVAGWRAIFWVQVGLGLCIGIAVLLRLPESRSEATAAQARAEDPVRSYLALLRRPTFMAYAVAGALNAAALFTYIASAPDLFIRAFGFAPTTAGWVFGLNSLGLILTGQLNRQLLTRYTPDRVLLVASFVSVVFGAGLVAAAFTGAGGQWSILASFFLIIATYGFLQGNSAAGALAQDPHRAGTASSLLGALSFGVGAGAAALTALFHDGSARPMAVTMFLVLLGSAACVWALAMLGARQRSAVA